MTRQLQRLTLALVAAGLTFYAAKVTSAAVSFSGDTSIGSQTIIGNSSFGTFRIDGGSIHTTSFGSVTMGAQTTGIGFATVTGPGSQWTLNSSSTMTVGNSGIGRLEVLDGGVINFVQFGGIGVGATPSAHGTVIVDGSGSLINVSGLTLGTNSTSGGSASLQISNDAIVNVSNNQMTTWPGGRVTLNGGLLRSGGLQHNGVLGGSGEVFLTSTSSLTNNGRIEAQPGDFLRINGSMFNVQNQGTIAADGATMEFQRAITTGPSGNPEITLRNSLMRAGTLVTNASQPQFTNWGLLAATGGLNDFYGRILNENNGRIAVANQSVMVFHDDVLADSGTIVVFPGSSAVFLEDLTINEGAVLLADLAGTGADSGFGEIEVAGNAQLAGSLQITLADGFTPQLGDAFPLLAASGISGSLSLGDVPELSSGLKWSLETEPNRVVLSVVPGLAGDYNGDGVVDGADYVLWRKTFGQQGAGLAADGNSNGIVDAGDYDFWQARVGNTFASGGGSATNEAPVPEPASAISLLAGVLLVSYRRYRLE